MNLPIEPDSGRSLPDERIVAVMKGAPGAMTNIDDRWYLYFGGTNYLGLAGNPEVIAAGCDSLRQYGVHSATTRAGFGNNPVTLAVEQSAAKFFGCEDAFYFSSGYVGNQIAIAALRDRHDAIYFDESAHYSLIEAARGSGLPSHEFRHRRPTICATGFGRRCRRAGGRSFSPMAFSRQPGPWRRLMSIYPFCANSPRRQF